MSSKSRPQQHSSAATSTTKQQQIAATHNGTSKQANDIEQQQPAKQQRPEANSDDSARRRSLDLDSSRSSSSSSNTEPVVTSLQVNSKTTTGPEQNVLPANSVVSCKQPPARIPSGPPLAAAAAGRPPAGGGRKAKRVLDPSGSLYYHWSMVVSVAFLYNFWSLSYRFAFREIDFGSMPSWFALDYSADLIYLVDIVINSRIGYLEDGVLQQNHAKVRQHYAESTLFYLDCLCLLPLDVLYLSFGFNSIFRFARLVKIYKFWSYVDRTERHTNYPNVFRTVTLVHYILVIFHWNACLFHMISKNKLIDIEGLYKINDNQCHDILCQYLHAFYWSTLALTTIGDLPRPRTKGEYIYVTVELFFGLFLFASVLGHVANIVTNVSAARKEFQAKLDAVKTFMRMRRVSDELQNKVIRWFDYLWISQQSSDEDKSVACLPDRLKAEIAIHVHLDTLKRVDIFQNTEAGFLCELVLRLKPVLFSPGDYVCRKNEVGHEMYIVSRGILEVVTDEGKVVVATLKAGSYFGEISVLNVGLAGNKRTASVRSVGYSDLFCLNKQDLWDVLKNYPNAEARIRARAEERLSKLDINSHGRRRSSGERRLSGSHHLGKAKQSPLEQQLPRGRHGLKSTSCGCFAASGAKGLSSMNNNDCCSMERRSSSNNNRPECVCRRCTTSQSTASHSHCNGAGGGGGETARPRMPFIGSHKSRASLNSGRRAAGMQHTCRQPPARFVCIHQQDNDDTDQLELESAAQCRLAGCRRHHAPPSDWLKPHEPVSYSRSFEQQSGRPAGRAPNQQDSNELVAPDQVEAISGNSSPADTDKPAPAAARSRRRFMARRSSSAEPPLDADSWRHLRRATAATNPSSSAASQRLRPKEETNVGEDCGRCRLVEQEAKERRQQQRYSRPTDGQWAATVDGRQPTLVGQLQQPPPHLTGYWLVQQQQQQRALPSSMPLPLAANQAATFVEMPTSVTITPDAQTSLLGPSDSGCMSGAINRSPISMPQPTVRAQSMSTMFLNLQSPSFLPYQQAALLSPALPSRHPAQSPLYFEPVQAEHGQRAASSSSDPPGSQQTFTRPAAAAVADCDAMAARATPTRRQENRERKNAHESKEDRPTEDGSALEVMERGEGEEEERAPI